MSKALAKKENTQLVTSDNEESFFDEAVIMDNSDILIPRLLLMQGVSQLVGQGKAIQGDLIDSVTGEVLGNAKKPIEVIPITQLDKAWVIEAFNGKKFEYERTDPWDSSLAEQREFLENGVKKRRNARLSFYVLLARDAETNHLPYMVSFQRTSYPAGKNLASFFKEAFMGFKLGDINSIPMARVFQVGCRIEQGDMGPYFVMETVRSRVATDAEREKAKYWFRQLKKASYKVHDDEKEISESESGVEKESSYKGRAF